jgi:protein-S-isoprenylcysteine O-methyltransferase Ste14
MSGPVFTLYELIFLTFFLLSRLFFRSDGRFHLMWWVTAVPFLLVPVAMLLAFLGVLTPWYPDDWRSALEVTSVFFGFGSLALVFTTLGTHRTRLALWHQEDDPPVTLVTYGPYGRIRHPFYTAFLTAFAGATIAVPHGVTLALFLYAVVLLNATAAREERRLSGSAFGAEYQQYMTRTGRFLPLPGMHRPRSHPRAQQAAS